MKCPECGNEFTTNTRPAEYNVEAYRVPAKVRASCCGKIVLMSPRTGVTLSKLEVQPDTDDWLN